MAIAKAAACEGSQNGDNLDLEFLIHGSLDAKKVGLRQETFLPIPFFGFLHWGLLRILRNFADMPHTLVLMILPGRISAAFLRGERNDDSTLWPK